mgnify:CR=1 FL=1
MITESSFSGSLSQRIRRRYFYSPMASLFTVVVSAVIAFIVGKLVLWGLVNAVWTPDVQACGAWQQRLSGTRSTSNRLRENDFIRLLK